MAGWRSIVCASRELHLPTTLTGGQCFRWHKNTNDEWTGVFANRVWTLKQIGDDLMYKVVHSENESKNGEIKGKRNKRKYGVKISSETKLSEKRASNAESMIAVEDEALLRDYLRLDFSLEDLYKKWSECDPNFKNVGLKFYGIRMLKQDPVENIFSFICSSNNHISRISSMVEKLCTLYGERIATVDDVIYFSFPKVDSLMDSSVEQTLRSAGFGYRAKFIQLSACKIHSMGGDRWLKELEVQTYPNAKTELMKLPGVGAKVADCICLMSLDHLQAIPVDTHVWQISCRYLPHLKSYKSVTDKVYNEIGNYFRDLYGPLAGWAHTVLFCADLKMFQDESVTDKKRKASTVTAGKKQPSRKNSKTS